MSYRIEALELYVRETPPGRMLVVLGRQAEGKSAAELEEERINPLAHVRMVVRDGDGNEAFGCAGDRLSVRWLDKRPGRDKGRKRRELASLMHAARDVYLQRRVCDSPFAMWRDCHAEIMRAGRRAGQEDLSSSFASALMERALVDAVCRLAGEPVFRMVKDDRLGIRPGDAHAALAGLALPKLIADEPQTRFFIRHTVGLFDPLTSADLPGGERLDDGLPETLEEYLRTDGVRYFKVKISGDVASDVDRLARLWNVVVAAEQPVVTLDANEAYADLDALTALVDRLERDVTGLFQHVQYIEQPLPRETALDPRHARGIRRLSERKPLIIDESDGTVEAFGRALAAGYRGTSHKNCKGFFKSLLNHALVAHEALEGREAFLSGEDLQNLPVVPLQQDFAALGVLGLEHCERNGHHYNRGLAHLSPTDEHKAVSQHADLYVRRDDESFLRITDGQVDCASLQCPGFGVRDEPDWASMEPLEAWLARRHPG